MPKVTLITGPQASGKSLLVRQFLDTSHEEHDFTNWKCLSSRQRDNYLKDKSRGVKFLIFDDVYPDSKINEIIDFCHTYDRNLILTSNVNAIEFGKMKIDYIYGISFFGFAFKTYEKP